jgi:hypothetical protein
MGNYLTLETIPEIGLKWSLWAGDFNRALFKLIQGYLLRDWVRFGTALGEFFRHITNFKIN